MAKAWLIRFWTLGSLFLAALGALLGLLPFTTAWGVVLLAVSLVSGAVLLVLGRGRFGEAWPKAARFFGWWNVALAVFALVLTLVLTGGFAGCEREVEGAAEEARSREIVGE
ncbi:MAG: hypothetical protein A2Y64_01570 [Candidatus Coatesbacteria bacterium RBG_13_66_14]|uniref:Uncharacterized protein n=1 Tax=Candidatus Coatesbacteria bacterium RBG_13_66_14 TaxID=1817816 RepID=A0A1F5EWV0_9BACT|nr:MAG: hypothetical protein A2Y64_01570 [Candidatus Coatesbacteria bacterium RBG_13_66_14]